MHDHESGTCLAARAPIPWGRGWTQIAGALTCVTRRELQASMTQRSQLTTSVAKRSGYIERRESGLAGAFTAKTREEADRVLEETIAKIATKQAIEKALKGLQGN